METLYIRRNVLNAAQIIEWAKGQGFETALAAEDMHVTIIFSKAPVDWDAVPETRIEALAATEGDRYMAAFGEAGEVAVLGFEAKELERRHGQLLDAGAESAWPDYHPHVTISHDPGDLELGQISPYAGPILLGPEIWEPVNEDWRSTVVEKVAIDAAKARVPDTGKRSPMMAKVAKVDESLGLVFGWAVICKAGGEDYYDLQDENVTEAAMLKAATDFAIESRVSADMHRWEDGQPVQDGIAVFLWPLTDEIAKAMGIKSSQSGLMIGIKPSPEVLSKFADGTYKGFSIGGDLVEYAE